MGSLWKVTMGYTRFVEIGRVALINMGPDAGKLCVILEVIDQGRVLVDGPSTVTGVARQSMPIKRIALTEIKIKVTRGARLKTLVKAFNDGDVMAKWNKTAWAQKLSKRTLRANMSDMDRFKAMLAKKQRSRIIKKEYLKLKKAAA